jgi:hypothetical protein
MPEIQHCVEYSTILQKCKATYKQLGITPEIEKAVMDYFSDIGALTGCAGIQGCTDAICLHGQRCVPGIYPFSCACTSKFQMDGERVVLKA